MTRQIELARFGGVLLAAHPRDYLTGEGCCVVTYTRINRFGEPVECVGLAGPKELQSDTARERTEQER